jgi:hypothetical protein
VVLRQELKHRSNVLGKMLKLLQKQEAELSTNDNRPALELDFQPETFISVNNLNIFQE